jgi:hypothetical protein
MPELGCRSPKNVLRMSWDKCHGNASAAVFQRMGLIKYRRGDGDQDRAGLALRPVRVMV